jgi:hypothetical protein
MLGQLRYSVTYPCIALGSVEELLVNRPFLLFIVELAFEDTLRLQPNKQTFKMWPTRQGVIPKAYCPLVLGLTCSLGPSRYTELW